jgi:phenylacetic acid degradation operon negative regulatory protein
MDQRGAAAGGRIDLHSHSRASDGQYAPAELAGQLWDLPGWTQTGHRLLEEMSCASGIPGRFVAATGIVRHVLTDPMLPSELLPADWPGDRLRDAYHDFATELARRRDPSLLEVTT